MGVAIGDYDDDGDLDWFVSSIWDPAGNTPEAWFASGNRLYRNRGDGTFDDVTDSAGVRAGYWGWGSTFADLDNDGDLDLFHVNGWRSGDASITFHADPSRLFVSNGNGTFTERSAEVGLVDTGLGRGVVAFDYDRDGDVDLFVAQNDGPGRLFRNDMPAGAHFLTVKLRGPAANSEGIGARITAEAGGVTRLRELRAGSNFESQDPAEAHFGLGATSVIDRVHVRWPDGTETERTAVAADAVVMSTPPALYDAKYKPAGPTPSADDVYQMITYCERLDTDEATLSLDRGCRLSTIADVLSRAGEEKSQRSLPSSLSNTNRRVNRYKQA